MLLDFSAPSSTSSFFFFIIIIVAVVVQFIAVVGFCLIACLFSCLFVCYLALLARYLRLRSSRFSVVDVLPLPRSVIRHLVYFNEDSGATSSPALSASWPGTVCSSRQALLISQLILMSEGYSLFRRVEDGRPTLSSSLIPPGLDSTSYISSILSPYILTWRLSRQTSSPIHTQPLTKPTACGAEALCTMQH